MIIYNEPKNTKLLVIESGLKLLTYAITLMLASSLFEKFYVSGFFTALIAALIIMLLNLTVKPFLKIITLPINILTLGLLYPFLDVIILKIASMFMGDSFIVEGLLIPFFIAIFISFVTLLLDGAITKKIVGGLK